MHARENDPADGRGVGLIVVFVGDFECRGACRCG